jgi:hypothetical protein
MAVSKSYHLRIKFDTGSGLVADTWPGYRTCIEPV